MMLGKPSSLKSRITWAFLLFAIGISFVFGWVGIINARINLRQTAQDNMGYLLTEKTLELHAWRSGVLAAASDIAYRPRLIATILDDILGDRLTDAERLTLSPDQSPNPLGSLTTWLGTGPGFVEFDIIDAESGLIRFSTNPDNSGLAQIDASVLDQAQQAPTLQQSLDEIDGVLLMTAVVPLQTPAGRTVGFLAARFPAAVFQEIATRIGPDSSPYQAYTFTIQNGLTDRPSMALQSSSDSFVIPPAVQTACAEESAGTLAGPGLQGVPVFSVYQWIDEVGHCLVVEVEESLVYENIRWMLWAGIPVGLIVLAAAMILGVLLARTIARPVEALEAGVQAVADGDLSYQVQDMGPGELGHLADAFNRMASQRMQAEVLTDAILDVTDALIIVLDRNAQILRVNKACTTTSGYSVEELVGTKLWDRLLPAEEEAGVRDAFDNLKAGMFPMSYRNNWVTKDGSLRLIDWSNNCVLDEAGDVSLLIGTGIDVTEKAAREAERDRLESLLESTTDLVAIASADGRITYINQAGREMLGYDQDEVIGLPIASAHPNWAAELIFSEAIPYAVSHGTWTGETEFRTADGRQIPVSQTIIAHLDSSDQVEFLSTIARDITLRVELEQSLWRIQADLEDKVRERTEALRLSEQRYRLLTESSQDLIFVIDEQDRVEYVNGQAAAAFGRTPEKIIGMPRSELFRGELGVRQRAALDQVLATAKPLFIEAPADFPDGRRWLSTWLVPMSNNPENAIKVMGISRDITEGKANELALIDSENRLRRAIIDAPFPIMLHAEDGEVLLISRTWTTLTGYTHTNIPTIAEWVRKAYGTKGGAVLKRIRSLYRLSQPINEGEYEIKTTYDTYQTWAFQSSPLGRTTDGRALVITMAVDVTERKGAEQALRDSELRLKRAVDRLENSNKDLEQFAYVASHDLQEPLRKVIAFGQRLERRYADKLDETGLDYLARMQGATARMQSLINDLLALSRITTRARPFEPVDLAFVLANVLDDLEMRLKETGAQFSVTEMPVVQADGFQVRQLLQNLISNALKFRSKEEVASIHISSVMVDEATVQISIADNGIGFDVKFSEQIFAPFHRLHSRSEYEGSGIGLAICRKIVERHGGTIWVESQVGVGSTFHFTLPLDSAQNIGQDL